MKGIHRNKIILAVLVIGSIGTAIYVASEKTLQQTIILQ